MLKRIFSQLVFAGLLFGIFACSGKKDQVVIAFSADRNSIVLKNIDEASLFQLKSLAQDHADSLELISVLLTPGDQDSLQMEAEVKGKTILQGDSLLFYPDSPFIKSKSYLVESYIGIKFGNADKLLKGGLKYNLRPQQQILTR